MKGLLEFLGVILCLGFCGAGIYILMNLSTVEQIEGYYYTYTTAVTNWNAIAIGVGLIVQGFFTLLFSFVLAETLRKTEKIISLIDKEKISDQENTLDTQEK